MTVWVPCGSKDFKMLAAPQISLPGIYSKELAARMFARVLIINPYYIIHIINTMQPIKCQIIQIFIIYCYFKRVDQKTA